MSKGNEFNEEVERIINTIMQAFPPDAVYGLKGFKEEINRIEGWCLDWGGEELL